jgi:uncharacterized protein (TIGR02246 family)
MPELKRPSLGLDRSSEPVDAFVRELQDAIDTGDAELFNQHFADDVLWGSPFGAVAIGYHQIHAIHARMFASVVPSKGASRYHVEHVRFPTDDVAVAYVRRLSVHRAAPPDPRQPGSFDELALLVLVRRDGAWWLAAGQHVPDRRDVYAESGKSTNRVLNESSSGSSTLHK